VPLGYSETALWNQSLASRPDDAHSGPRSRLESAYHKLRERAELVASEIPRDLPAFTVHDITHLDALWEMADLVGGSSITLTPTEAFVLGGAFMVHDLGMGLAAWDGGLAGLKESPRWPDALFVAIATVHGRRPTAADLADPTDDAVNLAAETLLRELHASQGHNIPNITWTSRASGEEYKLIEDTELRQRYGSLIGDIAASHGWPLAEVSRRFGGDSIGAPVDCPDGWTVDALKLACLLRVADAAHLDERRAPGFLRALRDPTGYSDLHWAFQGYLQRPMVVDDRILFTSPRPFAIEDAAAWWLCYETLQMVDRELASVDALLVDKRRSRFAARSVKGVEDPTRLAQLIPTAGWEPIDARVIVSNVPELVRKLGGASLYGDNEQIALRELIQNARDASCALAAMLSTPAPPILVQLEKDDAGDHWLSVHDSGIGMSRDVLTGTLLDFGTSYWGSDLMRSESVGLAASGYQPVGRFGIGFYSVFMLGNSVRVTSRRFEEASADTKVLDFTNGVLSRPIYRTATTAEVRHVGGTSVRVKLLTDPNSAEGLLSNGHGGFMSLKQLCAYLAPTLDADLDVESYDGNIERAVSASDWTAIDGETLLRRLSPLSQDMYSHADITLAEVGQHMRAILSDSGDVLARVALDVSAAAMGEDGEMYTLKSACTVGGLNASTSIPGIVGVMSSQVATADRFRAEPLADSAAWAEWGSRQAILWSEYVNEEHRENRYSGIDGVVSFLCRIGASTADIYVAWTADGGLNAQELRSWFRDRDEVLAVDDFVLDVRPGADGQAEFWHSEEHLQIELDDNVVFLLGNDGSSANWSLLGTALQDPTYRPTSWVSPSARSAQEWYYFVQADARGVALRLLAEAWDVSLGEVLNNTDMIHDRYIDRIGVSMSDSAHALDGSPSWRAKRANRI
jgi:hypothetical protein